MCIRDSLRDTQNLAQSLVVTKYERLAFLDRTARRAAELVSFKWGDNRAVKKVPGIHGAVAEELINVSMELVRAGLRNDCLLYTST